MTKGLTYRAIHVVHNADVQRYGLACLVLGPRSQPGLMLK